MSFDTRTTRSSDGVRIAYSISGSSDAALVLIHGGLADRSFWDGQHTALSGRFTVVTVDLAGHGESGRNREIWGIPEFAHDVVAVMDAEKLEHIILVGNSLGGAVAIEAALLAEKQTVGVIGVDTFHDLGRSIEPREAEEQAEAWRRDFDATLEQMLRALFHADVTPSLLADVRQRMTRASGEAIAAMVSSFGGYDTGAVARRLHVPLRCINGDLYPTDVVSIRKWVADFDAVILPHTGHFPMIERPDEFNRALEEFANAMLLSRQSTGRPTSRNPCSD